MNSNFKLALGLFIIFMMPFANAALNERSCVSVAVTDISPTSTEIGEEFTVGLAIENCGDITAENVTFELYGVSETIGVKEPLTKYIGSLTYANTNRFLVYHMKVLESALPGNYQFNYRVSYDAGDFSSIEEGSFSTTVIGEEADLGIASFKTTPVLPVEGETVELTIRIENSGEGTAKSVAVYMDHPFKGLKQSFIGTLESDEDGPVVLTFIADTAGEYNFPVVISYIDDFGAHEVRTQVNLSILDKPSNVGGIIIAFVFLGLIGGGVFYFLRMRRSKDKIIHQLLRGNGSRDR